jgi:putative ABC transport system permease protein
MTSLRVMWWRLLELVTFRRREARLSEEIEGHLALLSERYERLGLSRDEARLAARRDFGAVAPMAERYRDVRGLPWLDALALDLRFAWRLLARDRRFTATIVLVLGLGIGVNNMLFTILYAHTLRGLPIEGAARTAHVSLVDASGGTLGLSRVDFDLLTTTATSFEGLAAFTTTPAVVAESGQPPDRLEATRLTPTTFSLLGARPLFGRLFAPYDGRPEARAVAILSRAAWLGRYGGDPAIVGRSISIDGVPTTVVGVLPDRPPVPSTGQVWLPLGRDTSSAIASPRVRDLRVVGRLREGVTFEAATAELSSIANGFERLAPPADQPLRARVTPIDEVYFGSVTNPAWLAFMAVGILVALISCANVANLLLARGLHRTREIAMRLALGASRRRVARQLLIEACVLATLGGVVGIGVSVAGVRAFRSLIPENVLPWWFDYSVDSGVLIALAVVSLVTVLIFGLVPALHASKTDINQVLKDSGGRTPSRAARRWTAAFVIGELALTVVMLANLAVGLRLVRPDRPAEAALDRRDVLTATLAPSPLGKEAPARLPQFIDALSERLRATPGIDAVSVTSTLPLQGGEPSGLALDGEAEPDDAAARAVLSVAAGPRYFETLGLAMTRGREFRADDGVAPVAIVSPRFVERHMGSADPIGRRVGLKPAGSTAAPTWYTIVGVAPPIRPRPGPRDEPLVYVPHAVRPAAEPTVIIRSGMDSTALAQLLRREALALDATIAVDHIRSMSRVVADTQWNGRVASTLFQALCAIAVLLATVGLYAVTAHAVSQRMQELGVRVALGAGRRHVLRLVLRRVLMHVGLGFAVGAGFVFVWSRLFPSGRTDVTILDLTSLGFVATSLLVVGLTAAAGPLRRAMRVDPLTAIRQ